MRSPVLWHFTFSHFAEKARWALDWKGVAHVRRALLPGLHYPRIMWMTGQGTVPVLELDGTPIADSTDIIAALERRFPAPPLYPGDAAARERALRLEEFFDEEFGHYLRRFLMHSGFSAPRSHATGAAVFTSGFGRGTRVAFRIVSPAMQAFLRWRFDVTPATAEVARRKILAALDLLEAELQPSGYLVGDAFTVADLTAASLFAPLVGPPEFPFAAPAIGPAADLRVAADRRPGFQWVREMYRRHRGASAALAG